MAPTTDARTALEHFRDRTERLVREREDIQRELGQVDLLSLARRTRELVVSARELLENNVTVFYADSPRVLDGLVAHLQYADTHVAKALSEEYLFEAIKQRLYMATQLADYVIRALDEGAVLLEAQLDGAEGT